MNSQNKTIAIIVVSVFLIIVLLATLLFLGRKTTTTTQPTPSPTTPLELPTQTNPGYPTAAPSGTNSTPYQSPSIVLTPPSFTGALEVTFPPQQQAGIDQEFNLKNVIPVKMTTFTVDFDYTNDIFVVKITDQAKGQADFTDWLSKNYPAIPQNRFKVE